MKILARSLAAAVFALAPACHEHAHDTEKGDEHGHDHGAEAAPADEPPTLDVTMTPPPSSWSSPKPAPTSA